MKGVPIDDWQSLWQVIVQRLNWHWWSKAKINPLQPLASSMGWCSPAATRQATLLGGPPWRLLFHCDQTKPNIPINVWYFCLTNMACAMFDKRHMFDKSHMFDKLGIENWKWEQNPQKLPSAILCTSSSLLYILDFPRRSRINYNSRP